MIVSISGAQCTGKTTLLNALKEQVRFKNRTAFMSSPSRKGNDKGIRINKEAGLVDQLWIVTSYTKELIETTRGDFDNVISDRCILDMLCYTDYHYQHAEGIEKRWWEEMRDTVTQLLFHVEPLYNYHVILRPEFEIIPDGVRSNDPVFQKEIADLFEKNVNMLKDFVPEKIVYVTGSVEDRVQQILSL